MYNIKGREKFQEGIWHKSFKNEGKLDEYF